MDFEIIRTDRKTVAISIKNGRVILRAPKRFKDKDAERIIKEHEKWINKKLFEYQKKEAKKLELTVAFPFSNAVTSNILETDSISKRFSF